jgi:Ca2+-binding RTX toxin-like protein
MRNTDLGETGQGHIPGLIFDTPNAILEVIQAVQIGDDPTWGNPVLDIIKPLFIRTGFNAEDGNNHFLQYNGADHIVLGGSELSDTLIGGLGIDTLWGDGGNDRLDGGYEADKVYGGDGDDIITNLGGDDFLFGDDGNDVIHMGSGIVLGFGGRGNDFIMTGPDTQEVFAGEGDDFVLGNNGGDLLLGNEGNDWLEGGEGFDTLAGENSELFFNSPIVGHDVLNGQGNDTDYDGESGDDIMFQSSGIQRSNGMAGFDWAVHKGDPNGADSDLGIPIFVNQEAVILRDRFDLVEGLSGWVHDDVLTGRQVVTGANGVGGAAAEFDEFDKWESFSNTLLQSAVDRIDGFDALVAHLDRVQVTWAGETKTVVVMDETAVARTGVDTASFVSDTAADILLGGGGNDRFMGKAGNDIIDGDKWLNVRLAISGVLDHPAATADTLTGPVYDNLTGEVLFGGRPLNSMMLDRTLNPGQLSIVREILDGDEGNTGIDTAVYRDLRENYSVVREADGSITVTHLVAAPVGGGNNNDIFDGSDRLFNIERLEFADLTVTVNGANSAPVGELLITGLVREDATLSASVQFSDEDLIEPGSMVFTWQMMTGTLGVDELWLDVGTGQNFVPGDAQVERPLRVIATYVDGLGVNESVTSSATAPVQNVNDAPTGLVSIDDISPVVTQTLFVSNSLADADGMGVVGYQWQSSTNGVDWSDIVGETGNSYTAATVGVQLRVAASYTDVRGANETVFSSPVTAVVAAYNVITGTAGVDGLNGTDLPDHILGLASDDFLSGGLGNDLLDGGTGNDTMVGGDGNDTYVLDSLSDVIIETATGGVDTVLSSLTEYTLGANLENATLTGTANTRLVGNDLDNVLTGNSGNNRLVGGNGNDTVIGNGGADTLNGGSGADHLDGSGGNDIYLVDDAGDVVFEAFNAGTDEVQATMATYTLTDNVENLRFTGLGSFSGTGNGLNNRLTSGSGDDTLDGGAGVDTMLGGTGNDTYHVDNTSDFINEALLGGVDTVFTTTSYSLGSNVENLVSTNATGATLRGNGLANQITGGSGADSIFGGNGNDTIEGGAGNDTMAGGGNNDVFVFNAGFGADTINGFDSNPLNGQDLLDISGLGISAATFGAEVNITGVVGTGTVVSFTGSADTITLIGVNAANVTQQDFILA